MTSQTNDISAQPNGSHCQLNGTHSQLNGTHAPQPNGTHSQVNGHSQPSNGTHPRSSSSSYTILERPLGTPRQIRVIVIGAGASGINFLRALRLGLPPNSYSTVVYEKNHDVGGTWLENAYPGCRCDIPSHSYQFSWRRKKDWSNFFAAAEEIEEYLREAADEVDPKREVIRTGHEVVGAWWEEEKGKWRVRVKVLETGEEVEDEAEFVVDGTGILNNWKWPDVPGREDYEGTLIHTARWPKDFDHTDKTIVVIGNGASGVQVLPELQRGAKKLYHVIRSPTWIVPPRIQAWKIMGQAGEILSKIQLDEHENFSQETIDKFKSDPEFYREFVKKVEVEVNNTFPVVLLNSPIQAFARAKVTEYMRAALGGNQSLCDMLIPDFPLGFRRMTPAHAYLRALTQDNVEVRRSEIRRFVRDGVELAPSGEVIEADAIVCATGFDTSFCPRFPVVGRDGVNLQQRWREEMPRAYMSVAVDGVPNYFMFFGPSAPAGHGSIFTLTEHIARYIVTAIRKCQTEGIRALCPSRRAVADYAEHIDTFMPRTAWAAPGGRSWFKNSTVDGPVTALHPGSRIHFFHMLEAFRGEDWEYVYEGTNGNRFAYLGNGFSTKELQPGVDSTWYLDEAGW